jgi:hypothetical protein
VARPQEREEPVLEGPRPINSELNFPQRVESRLSGFHNSLNFARQTDHGFPLIIDFDRPSKPRIESQLSDNHASVAIHHDTIFV